MLIDELQDALLHSQVSGHVSPGTPWRPYLLALPVRIGWTWWWRCAVHPPLISTTSLLMCASLDVRQLLFLHFYKLILVICGLKGVG